MKHRRTPTKLPDNMTLDTKEGSFLTYRVSTKAGNTLYMSEDETVARRRALCLHRHNAPTDPIKYKHTEVKTDDKKD